MKTHATASSEEFSRQQFDQLCAWIESHLEEPIGWQQMFEHSALDFSAIQALFFKHARTTPMTWIRKKRQGEVDLYKARRPVLTLKKRA